MLQGWGNFGFKVTGITQTYSFIYGCYEKLVHTFPCVSH